MATSENTWQGLLELIWSYELPLVTWYSSYRVDRSPGLLYSFLLATNHPQIPELGSFLFDQCRGPPYLHDTAGIHHDDPVKVHDHLQPMTYHDDCVSLKFLSDDLLHGPVGVVVNTGAELVEEQDTPLRCTCLPIAIPKTPGPYFVPQ